MKDLQAKNQLIQRMMMEGVEERPGILFIGSSNVGKRTLLSRLVSSSGSLEFEDENSDSASSSTSSDCLLVRGWTIDNKYYTAHVSICLTHLSQGFSLASLPVSIPLVALVMVFDLTELLSLIAVQDWVSRSDIHKFDIRLCIGNKVDRLPGHPVHAEYRRRLLKNVEESSVDGYMDEFGISESEGSSLLGDDDPSWEIRRSCLEWCTEHNIEFIEACASNADFDKCLSVNGDSQGLERLHGALSAHMWPGMILKSGNKISNPSLPDKEEVSEEESDYEFEYEVLSAGSAEPWDDTFGGWTSADGTSTNFNVGGPTGQYSTTKENEPQITENFGIQGQHPSASRTAVQDDKELVPRNEEPDKVAEPDEVSPFDFEDLEHLMSEIGNARDNLRFMPDLQRRETAAKLAMKLAAMFGGASDDEVDSIDETHATI